MSADINYGIIASATFLVFALGKVVSADINYSVANPSTPSNSDPAVYYFFF